MPFNTDDNPCLEYSAPFSLYSLESFSANLAWVAGVREGYNQQDWQDAYEDFAAAYPLRPFCDYTSAQAYCLVKMRRWSDAEAMVRRALQENPYDVRSFLVEGLIAEHQGRDDDALNSLRRVCRECPFIQEAWLRSAEILARRGDRSGTRKIIQDYLVFYPEDKQLRNMLKEL